MSRLTISPFCKYPSAAIRLFISDARLYCSEIGIDAPGFLGAAELLEDLARA